MAQPAASGTRVWRAHFQPARPIETPVWPKRASQASNCCGSGYGFAPLESWERGGALEGEREDDGAVATFDVVFAADSIPAIFAITRDTFIVYAANAFSLLGLAALYFVLAGMMGRFPLPERGNGSRAHLRRPEDGAEYAAITIATVMGGM